MVSLELEWTLVMLAWLYAAISQTSMHCPVVDALTKCVCAAYFDPKV